MPTFPIYTPENAPVDSKATLSALQEQVGFLPNVFGLFAASPGALTALTALNVAFSESSFTPAEREIIALTTSVANVCGYCIAGHSTFAAAEGVDADIVEAVRIGGIASDPKLEALHRFTRTVMEKKGALDAADTALFLDAGYLESQVFDVLIGVAAKVMTNFASKTGNIPIDAAFQDHAWKAEKAAPPKALAA